MIELDDFHNSLAKNMAIRYCKSNRIPSIYDFDDILGYAYVGLIESLIKFKYGNKNQFIKYARLKIDGAIKDGLYGRKSQRENMTEVSFEPLEDEDTTTVECCKEEIERQDTIQLLRNRAWSVLSTQEEYVIGLIYYCGNTFTKTAEILELTTGRISQIHSEALQKLRIVLENNGINSLN